LTLLFDYLIIYMSRYRRTILDGLQRACQRPCCSLPTSNPFRSARYVVGFCVFVLYFVICFFECLSIYCKWFDSRLMYVCCNFYLFISLFICFSLFCCLVVGHTPPNFSQITRSVIGPHIRHTKNLAGKIVICSLLLIFLYITNIHCLWIFIFLLLYAYSCVCGWRYVHGHIELLGDPTGWLLFGSWIQSIE
jgi:hypothetical protein